MDESTTGGPIDSGGGSGQTVPRRVGTYRLGRKIGEGGMGVVYAGTHERLGRRVAIKFIGIGRPSPEMLRRFDQERDVLSMLSHPAIATVFDAGEAEHGGELTPYIVMEYVVGAESVREYCERVRPSPQRLIEMFESLFDALEHAHSRGIIHRDLTPRNILVDSEGRPKIIDFGLSLPRGARGAVESLDAEGGQPAGTPAYMSPEQRSGDPHAIDHRTDLYSLALVFREVLDASRSWGQEMLDAIRTEVDEVLVACLTKSPAGRPARAADVRAALEAVRERLIADVTGMIRVPGFRGSVPALFGWLAASVSAAVSAFGVFPLCCAVLPLCMWYGNAAVSMVGPARAGDPLGRVRVVALSLDMLESEHLRVNGEKPNIFALRARHADLLDRLTEAGASAIAFDLRFGRETEHDEGFAEGIRRTIDHGVPVVLFDKFWMRSRGPDDYAPRLLAAASEVAPGTGSFFPESEWKADIAARLGDNFLLPSLSLATVGRVGHADVQLSISAQVDEQEVHVRRWRPDRNGSPQQVGPRIVFPVSGWTKADASGAAVGLSTNDHVAQLLLSVPSDDVLDSVTIRYDDVLDPSGGFNPDSVRDRIVLVGRQDDPLDIKKLPDGRAVPGVYAHAVAIQSLLSNVAMRSTHDRVMRLLCAAAASLGVGILLIRRWPLRRRWLTVGIAGVGIVALCFASLLVSRIVYPSPLVGSLLLGAITAASLSAMWTRRIAALPEGASRTRGRFNS